MTISRKQFFKTACLSSACLCGFGAIAGSAPSENQNQEDDSKTLLFHSWIAGLLTNIDSSLGEEDIRKVIKSSALAHYNDLKMDSILAGRSSSSPNAERFRLERAFAFIAEGSKGCSR